MYQKNIYSPDDIRKMQKDAIKRVQNMQMKARETIKNSFNSPNPPLEKITPTGKKYITLQNDKINNNLDDKSCNKNKDTICTNNINGIINLLFKDQEKTLIITLILLLIKDNGDPSIIFALIYILI